MIDTFNFKQHAFRQFALIPPATLVFAILAACYLYNLGYNSPFSDEAIYIVLGKLALFQWDWTSFAASDWMAGSLYAYPPLSAIAYSGSGIIGSRFLSVIFGLIAVYSISRIAMFYVDKQSQSVTQIIVILLLGFSSIAIYISRLATYDIPAFSFLCLSWLNLENAHRQSFNKGQWYFLSALFLAAAILTKITSLLYAPGILALALYHHKTKTSPPARIPKTPFPPRPQPFYFWRYFVLPLTLFVALYLITHAPHLVKYITTYQGAENASTRDILTNVSRPLFILAPTWTIASLIILKQRRFILWFTTTLGALWIITFHLLTHRLATFDKHLIYTVTAVAIMGGIGFGSLFTRHRQMFSLARLSTVFLLGLYLAASFPLGYRFSTTWANTTAVHRFLGQVIKPSDYVLSEEGQVTMLATYNLNHPLHTTTLDWFSYQEKEGKFAYRAALKDAHFNYLILHQDVSQLNDYQQTMHHLIIQTQDHTYVPVFEDGDYIVYAREYQ